jgi:hypothetical protein
VRRVLRGLKEFLGANFGGAICEWACALPRIALVTKTRGVLKGFLSALWGRSVPIGGRFNHKNVGLGGCEEPARATRSATE